MHILFIVPGSGDSFYCGNCFRDNLQAQALRKAGHEITIMPLYLPLGHLKFQADTPLFFPATSYYVAHKFFRNRAMPRWMQRLMGSDSLLNLASSMSGTTSAKGMEAMTLSMIMGDDPTFANYVAPLIAWIKESVSCDVIHLSSSLLLGVAKEIKQQLQLPVVCSLQDEEVWIDSLQQHHASQAWQGVKENRHYVDRFIASSQFYRARAQQLIPEIEKIAVVYPGIDCAKYQAESYPQAPTIGFFYRMNDTNGLDLLVDAFVQLKKSNTIKGLKLKIGGGYTALDKRFLRKIRKRLQPYMHDVELCTTYSLDAHSEFYKQITLICVPIKFEEGVGLYLCEAFAAGRPAVEPATGSFPEIVGNAGLLYHPNHPNALAAALEQLLTDEAALSQYKQNALKLSAQRYSDNVCATQLTKLYSQLLEG